MLAIWGLVEAHAESTEYSAQGIGRTVASVVAAGVRTGMRIVVGGVKSRGGEGFDDGVEGMDVQVPVLNSTVKLGKEMEVVARGRVNVTDIFLRWFIWKEYEDEDKKGQGWEQEEEEVAAGVEEPHGEGEEQVPLASGSGESDDDEL